MTDEAELLETVRTDVKAMAYRLAELFQNTKEIADELPDRPLEDTLTQIAIALDALNSVRVS